MQWFMIVITMPIVTILMGLSIVLAKMDIGGMERTVKVIVKYIALFMTLISSDGNLETEKRDEYHLIIAIFAEQLLLYYFASI